MWQRYFKFIKLVPGRVDTALLGIIDFSNPNIPVEKIQKLYESDFPYLELTPEGKKYLYGQDDQPQHPPPEPEQVPEPESIEPDPEPAIPETPEEPEVEPHETDQTATIPKKKPYRKKKTPRPKE